MTTLKKALLPFRQLSTLGPADLTLRTGCVPSCELTSFRTRTVLSDSLPHYPGVHPPNYTTLVQIMYSGGDYLFREEYLDYDFKDLVADFGGYLGLLLGHSLLSFFDMGHLLCKRCKKEVGCK